MWEVGSGKSGRTLDADVNNNFIIGKKDTVLVFN